MHGWKIVVLDWLSRDTGTRHPIPAQQQESNLSKLIYPNCIKLTLTAEPIDFVFFWTQVYRQSFYVSHFWLKIKVNLKNKLILLQRSVFHFIAIPSQNIQSGFSRSFCETKCGLSLRNNTKNNNIENSTLSIWID